MIALLLPSCWPWGRKKEDAGQRKPATEGKWVYSQQKPSPPGGRKGAVSYDTRPYQETEETGISAPAAPAIGAPYLLGGLKYKVVVLEFEGNISEDARGIETLVTQEIVRQLEDSGAIVVMDLELVRKSVTARDGNLLDRELLKQLRRILGVHGVVSGSVEDVMVGSTGEQRDAEAMAVTEIEAKVTSTETGLVIRSVRGENPVYASHAVGRFSRDKALSKAASVALQQVSDGIIRGFAGLEWSTTVASVEGNTIYLNAGKKSGLQLGDILEVYAPGKEIIHPVTKLSLGMVPGALKGNAKVTRLFGFDAAEVELAEGGKKVATGDVVRPTK
jgi:hypothetical protein